MTPQLTILGLGPGNPEQRTLEANAALASADRILLRTGIHPGVDDLLTDPRVSTCDDLYDAGRSFDEVYTAVVDRVLTASSTGALVYAVPGHPLIGERTVTALLAAARRDSISLRMVPGLSAIDAIGVALSIDVMESQAQLIDGAELARFLEHDPFNGSLPDLSPLRPVLVSQVYAPFIASAVKIALSRLFPDVHAVTIVTAAGVAGSERVETCSLFELDRQPVDHLTSVWVPSLTELEATRSALSVHRIAARLRAPDGCPWDRKQSHVTLKSAVIEEAYEVVDAIDEADPDHLAEELGDLLLQVAMHAQIADESGDFSVGDVFDHINRKLVRRHPHVFGEVVADDPDAVIQTWNEVKASERRTPAPVVEDPFDRLPRSMPVLTKVGLIAAEPAGEHPVVAQCDRDGEALLSLVESLVKSGLDPEKELERAYRARSNRSNANVG